MGERLPAASTGTPHNSRFYSHTATPLLHPPGAGLIPRADMTALGPWWHSDDISQLLRGRDVSVVVLGTVC